VHTLNTGFGWFDGVLLLVGEGETSMTLYSSQKSCRNT